jgi:hypothetical protein
MDRVQCWRKGIESDQGYQNYLFYKGFFHTNEGNATLFHQGDGIVNTIGAMNGKRYTTIFTFNYNVDHDFFRYIISVPKEMKGPLDVFWKVRDKDGFILNNDGTRSAVVHQWDRFYSEIIHWLDKTLY